MVLPKTQIHAVHGNREDLRTRCCRLLSYVASERRMFKSFKLWLLLVLLRHVLRLDYKKAGRMRDSQEFYFGPPVHIFLRNSQQPLETRIEDCPTKLRNLAKTTELAVAVIASSRADYLRQVLQSLEKQTVQSFHGYLFLDYCESQGCKEVLALSEKFVAEDPQRFSMHRAEENKGIARMSLWAIDAILEDYQYHWDRFLLLEDDHLIGHTYIEALVSQWPQTLFSSFLI